MVVLGSGKGEMTKQKALDIILDAKAKDAELLKMSLEDATTKIAEMQKEFRDEAARLGEDAEEDEDDAQVQGDYCKLFFFLAKVIGNLSFF